MINYSNFKRFSELFLLSMLSYVASFASQMAISYYFGTSKELDGYFAILAAASFLLFYINPIKDALVKIVYDQSVISMDKASQLFSSGLILQVVLAISSSLLLFFKPLSNLLSLNFKGDSGEGFVLILVPYFFLFAIAETTNGLLLSFNKLRYQAFARLVSAFAGLICIFLLAKVYGIWALLFSLQITQLIVSIVSLVGLRNVGVKFVFFKPGAILKYPGFLPILSSLLVGYFFAQVYVVLERFTMIRMNAGLVASFQYSVVLVNVGISIIVQPVLNMVWPKFLAENSNGDERKILKLAENACLFMICVLGAGCLFVYLNAFDVIKLIYSRGKFDENSILSTSYALKSSIFTAIPIGIYGVLTRVLITRGQAKQLAFAALSIALAGMSIIILASAFHNVNLIYYHWLIGNSIGAVVTFMIVKSKFKDFFHDYRHWAILILKLLVILGFGYFSLNNFNHFFSIANTFFALSIKFVTYVGTIVVLSYLLSFHKHLKINE